MRERKCRGGHDHPSLIKSGKGLLKWVLLGKSEFFRKGWKMPLSRPVCQKELVIEKDTGRKRMEGRDSNSSLHTHVHSVVIHDSQKMETLTDEGINKMWYIQTMEDGWAWKWNEILTHVMTRINLGDMMLSEKNPDTKAQTLHDSTNIRSLEESSS